MPRTAGQEAAERAERTFERMYKRFTAMYGLRGEAFEKVSEGSTGGLGLDPLSSLRYFRDGTTFVRPEWEAHGLVSHVSVGTFAFFVSVLEPWEATLSLTATIVLGNHRGIRRADLLSRLVDPERRIGLGPWYEIASDFACVSTPHWRDGFYARRGDKNRARLDRICRRQRQLVAAKPYTVHEEILFKGLWEHFLSRKTF